MLTTPFSRLAWAVCALTASSTVAFGPHYASSSTSTRRPATSLAYKNDKGGNEYNNSNNNDNDDSNNSAGSSWQVLNERLYQIRLDVLEKELQMPPHPRLSACDFVQQLLQHVLHNEDPLPESGFRLLLRTATDEWKQALYDSVGAPLTAPEDVVASALGEALSRPNNQYALLVGSGAEDDDDDDENNSNTSSSTSAVESSYVATFPHEPLDYYDGTAWVECHLRDKHDNKLLVSTGWELRRNPEGAWMVAKIDWQDFRDKFRPGVGREEWMRLCN